MEASWPSETLLSYRITVRCSNPEERDVASSLKSHFFASVLFQFLCSSVCLCLAFSYCYFLSFFVISSFYSCFFLSVLFSSLFLFVTLSSFLYFLLCLTYLLSWYFTFNVLQYDMVTHPVHCSSRYLRYKRMFVSGSSP
jgi:hypothetical protein